MPFFSYNLYAGRLLCYKHYHIVRSDAQLHVCAYALANELIACTQCLYHAVAHSEECIKKKEERKKEKQKQKSTLFCCLKLYFAGKLEKKNGSSVFYFLSC